MRLNCLMTRHRTECLKSSLRQHFFGLREICFLGFGGTIVAFDNISGCFYSVKSAITVFTLANNLRHWYFVSWLNTDGYFTSHFLTFGPSSRQTPVMLQCFWCAELTSKSFITLNPTSPDTVGLELLPLDIDLEEDIPLVMVIFLVAFSVRCLFITFLPEDKLSKKKDVLHKFAFLLHNLCCFSLSLLFSFAPMPTMPKITANWMTQRRIWKKTKSCLLVTFCASFLNAWFFLQRKPCREVAIAADSQNRFGCRPDFSIDSSEFECFCKYWVKLSDLILLERK